MARVECGHWDTGIKRWDPDLLILHGPSIQVDIGFDPAFDPVRLGKPPNAITKNAWALIDTGAQESFIDTGLADALTLPLVDMMPVSGSAGRHVAPVYSAQMYIPPLNFTIWGTFAGVNLVAGGQQHMALIGRTFLAHHKMIYDGTTGRVALSD